MSEYQTVTGHPGRESTEYRIAKKPTELKVAFDCLLYYVGMLAFGQPIGTFEECAKGHYALYGIELTAERFALVDALRPLLIDGGVADRSCADLITELQALGWKPVFLKREVD